MSTGLAAADLAVNCPEAARTLIRSGVITEHTSGLASGFAQANLVVLPRPAAAEFLRFCVVNRQTCPLIDITEPGSPVPGYAAPGADLRTDLPRYRVFRDGQLVDETTDVTEYWRADLVAFLLGCSFTFEWALTAAGLPLAHQKQQVNVPMYVTNRACVPMGAFGGPLVVSMRPYRADDALRAAAVTARFPAMHGQPLHIGDPTELGIADLDRPDFGDAVTVASDEVPVFWACGVTPQVVVQQARPDLAIFHMPGHMFITDLPHTAFELQERSHVPQR
ncbi:putative hydro-lyase [Mycolicibacterium mengxianglii]|uniref:putative hydro-lyase n=1 Tax=Mycolicibacterium mengxianglii TaxID=2736649 RepID=UPI0018D1A036|nr:putative hydro-lyase [Mycolicibacterium mengxianglii]